MKSTSKISKRRYGSTLFGIAASLIFLLVLTHSSVAIDYMNKALKLCSLTVIPSLFPFMVISELIISSGVGRRLSQCFSGMTKMLFGVGEGGACAFVLGTLCGFPIGARTAKAMFDRGEITKKELSMTLNFCNNPGSAFVISAIGISVFGDRRVGSLLYVCVILSAVIVGIFSRFFYGKTSEDTATLRVGIEDEQHSDPITSFTSAIRNSALSMLTVCAFVLFFSAFLGCLGAFLDNFVDLPILKMLLFGLFELSGGVSQAVGAKSFESAFLLCAAFAGWSGFSVHFQIITVTSGCGLSYAPYFIAKAAQGVICATLAALCTKFVFPGLGIDTLSLFSDQVLSASASRGAFVCFVFFAASLLPVLLSRLSRGAKKRQLGIDKQ